MVYLNNIIQIKYTITLNKAGTIEYCAPEIKKYGICNEKSDIYSLGCIIYELFNLSKYYDDFFIQEIKKIDYNIYNKKWQEIINSLFLLCSFIKSLKFCPPEYSIKI